MSYPREPEACRERLDVQVRVVTRGKMERCKALLNILYRHATFDAVISQACDKLERALRDECKRKGIDIEAELAKRLNPKGKPAPVMPEIESRRPMISE